ncbi:hypothetical protein Syun_018609 [Stephania yunnanensis]|uniref:Uncharacterized protein n=1 Tax=Stephania yunnanensis TaxID=152371 RepID=A0AAP0IUH2_9MAGN
MTAGLRLKGVVPHHVNLHTTQASLKTLLLFRTMPSESVTTANAFEMANQVVGFFSRLADCTLSSTTPTNQSGGGTTGAEAHEEHTLICINKKAKLIAELS